VYWPPVLIVFAHGKVSFLTGVACSQIVHLKLAQKAENLAEMRDLPNPSLIKIETYFCFKETPNSCKTNLHLNMTQIFD